MVLIAGGATTRLYLVGAIWSIGAIPTALGIFVSQTSTPEHTKHALRETFSVAWEKIPFASGGMHLLIGHPGMIAVTSLFPAHWVAQGDLLASIRIFGFDLPMNRFPLASLSVCICSAVLVMAIKNRNNAKPNTCMAFGSLGADDYTINPAKTIPVLIAALEGSVSLPRMCYLIPCSRMLSNGRTTHRSQAGGIFYGSVPHSQTTGALVIFHLAGMGWVDINHPLRVTQFSSLQ